MTGLVSTFISLTDFIQTCLGIARYLGSDLGTGTWQNSFAKSIDVFDKTVNPYESTCVASRCATCSHTLEPTPIKNIPWMSP